ncbi:hypothetical protein PIB30_042954 [Stylosanthes scabra]|uniref:BHLH domain-containing protein n=1 Tax=Stylosanthes scabra TaxID=79078 RepID=A0ABU6YFV2_9FABA|nr:hypothetical protein [Stylosanthes scabra]
MSGGGSASSSLSFEEIISFNGGQSCDHSSKEGSLGNNNNNNNSKRRTKKGRNSREALDHIISERRRRQQLAEKFIALAAAIPGLKKIDKASILEEATNYVRQLEEHIALLEKENNNKKEPLIVKKSSQFCSSSLLQCDDKNNKMVPPEVEARWLEKEVLIRIQCEKQKGIMLKLLPLLQNNHLSLVGSTLLPFGNSTLNVIIIIAQMNEGFNLTLYDLVKMLREDLIKFMR